MTKQVGSSGVLLITFGMKEDLGLKVMISGFQ